MPPPTSWTPPSAGLRVEPFRGVRYAPGRVADLAAVTSPPYDVVDADEAGRLERLDPHNVVHLILPRASSGDTGSRYESARRMLDDWLADGTLLADDGPSLYVYEQTPVGGTPHVGILAGVGVAPADEAAILPHEHVMPGPIADRFDLMRATRANLEPILLAYCGGDRDDARRGGGGARQLIERVLDMPALIDVVAEDGSRHRIWHTGDAEDHRAVSHDLAHRTALIADGHHRYATYRRLCAAAAGDRGDRPGPWGVGLALLVDTAAYPLSLAAIHRVVAGLAPDVAAERVVGAFTVTEVTGSLAHLVEQLRYAGRAATAIAFGDGNRWWLAHSPREDAVTAAMADQPESWARLDVAIVSRLVLGRLWDVDDARTTCHHSADGAVNAARREAGTAVLLNPPTFEQVAEVVAGGAMMPRKSTSFGPKPRSGFVLRLVEDGALP